MLKAQNWRFHSITIRFRTTCSYIHRVSLLFSYFDISFSVSLGWTGRRNILGIGTIFSGFAPPSPFGIYSSVGDHILGE